MAMRRPIRQKEILNPDRILANLLKDYVDGNLDDYTVLYRAVVVKIDHVGGVLEQEPPNPKNSIKARVITSARDKDLDIDDLSVFWPMFPYDIVPVKEGEHVYVLYEDAGNKSHGLWLTRIPEPNNVDSRNITPGSKKYTEDPNNDFSEVGAEQAIQDTDGPPDPINVSEEFTPEEVQPFTARVGDRTIEGSNNTIIVLGRDRPSALSSGEQQGAGTIDIVAGRSSSEDMSIADDKSRIYVSMKTDIDGNLGIDVGSSSGPTAAIGIKSDEVRVIARNGMKLVVEGGNIHLEAKEILLGKEAKESLILGDKFMKELDIFLSKMDAELTAGGSAFGIPSTVFFPATLGAVKALKAKLQQLLSKKSKTE